MNLTARCCSQGAAIDQMAPWTVECNGAWVSISGLLTRASQTLMGKICNIYLWATCTGVDVYQ